MKNIIWFFLIVLIFIRYFTTRPVYKNGDPIRITGVIYSDTIIYPGSQYFKIAGLKVYSAKYPEINYGDTISVEGLVEDGALKKPKILSVKAGTLFSNFRNSVINFYQNSLPQPESGLLAGIVLGAKGSIDADFYNLTKTAGVAHIVVASGTNVTFVISFLTAVLFVFLPRRRAIPFVLVGIISYLFISGFDAPLIRAALMSGMVFLAQKTGRVSATWRIFFLTGGLMLAYNPDWITDIGFLLSFASTGSILLFQKRIQRILRKIPGLIREDLSTTLSAQVGVSPILFVTFGQFNIWSPLINILVLWTVPPLMIIGSVGGLLGFVSPLLGKITLYLAYPMLWWFVRVVSL